MSENVPQVGHHLDKRAAELADDGRAGDPDDLMTTGAVAEWLQVSSQWVELGRSKGYGPKFIRLSPTRVRYRRVDVLRWLDERTQIAVAKYARDRATRAVTHDLELGRSSSPIQGSPHKRSRVRRNR